MNHQFHKYVEESATAGDKYIRGSAMDFSPIVKITILFFISDDGHHLHLVISISYRTVSSHVRLTGGMDTEWWVVEIDVETILDWSEARRVSHPDIRLQPKKTITWTSCPQVSDFTPIPFVLYLSFLPAPSSSSSATSSIRPHSFL